jgi:hypothetical protein
MYSAIDTLGIQTLSKSLEAILSNQLLDKDKIQQAAQLCAEQAFARLDERSGARHDSVGTKAAALDLLARCAESVPDYKADTVRRAMAYLRYSERIVTADELQRAQAVLSALQKCAVGDEELLAEASEFLKGLVTSTTFGHLALNQMRFKVHVNNRAMTSLVAVLCDFLAHEVC